MVKVKVCGITNLKDALAAAEMGADALGFVFAPSPRRVTPPHVAQIAAALPPFICKVGVFVDNTLQEVTATVESCSLDLAQLHGSESPEFCQALFPRVIKSFRVRDESVLAQLAQYEISAYLLDSYHEALSGGTGVSFDWEIARKAGQYGLIILSGGLNPANVRRAITEAQPFAVDVSSGVEASPGVKDHAKLRTFIEEAKNA